MVDAPKNTNTSEEKDLFPGSSEKESIESASESTKITQNGVDSPAKGKPIVESKIVSTVPLENIAVAPSKPATLSLEKGSSLENDLEELISAAGPKLTDTKKVDFGASEDLQKKETNKQKIIKEKKLPQRIFNNILLLGLLVLILSLVGVFYSFLTYKETQGNVPPFLEKYMPQVEKTYYSVRNLLGYPIPSTYSDNMLVPKGSGSNAVAEIIQDSRIDYISKREILGKGVVFLYGETSSKYDQYEALKRTISQQGFFPVELQKLSEGGGFNNSLQKGIISIESVRFATALNFFSSLDSFMTQLSALTSVSKPELTDMIEVFIKRGEKDINNYVVSCYLNGYETSTTCTTIGDFSRYYSIYPTTGFNERVFLSTMKLIQDKLENTDIPSLDISMRSINPLENTINLNVEINTFKDDELQLIQSKNILNPHIYLVTSIINNLRESRYVLTDAINISSLKVNKKKIKVGGETYVVNSSSFSFQLPLQSNVQREIYDFTDMGQRNVADFFNTSTTNLLTSGNVIKNGSTPLAPTTSPTDNIQKPLVQESTPMRPTE